MNTCNDCKYFTLGGIEEEGKKDFQYYAPDGICHKHFPRGYIGRKPPHKKYHNSNACFQFEKREE